MMSLGIATNRDDWVYGRSVEALSEKIREFSKIYAEAHRAWAINADEKKQVAEFGPSIKWTTELQQYARRGQKLTFEKAAIRRALYRPFCKMLCYYRPVYVHRPYQQNVIFPVARPDQGNLLIAVSDPTSQKPWMTLAADVVPDLHVVGAASGTMCLPLWRFKDGERVDNITDWALNRFRERYKPVRAKKERAVEKEDIFHYVYGVLHDPMYRHKYAQNLKWELPRIPFYDDFWIWAGWGSELLRLHIGYETVDAYALSRKDVEDTKARQSGTSPRAYLRAEEDKGQIVIDSETTLSGVPEEAWSYLLGNRSAIDWVLEHFKEKAPRDRAIRQNFNTYRFAKYKEEMIDLLRRVTTVSVETMKIVASMEALPRLTATLETEDE